MLYDKLRVGFDVFFFPGNQEALAGTEGLESMRAPFRRESRLNVVLLTPAKKAGLNRAEEDYRRAKASMSSADGMAKVFSNVKELFQEIRRLCDEVNAGGNADIEYRVPHPERSRRICGGSCV